MWQGGVGMESEGQMQAEGLGTESEDGTGLPAELEMRSCRAGLAVGLQVAAQGGHVELGKLGRTKAGVRALRVSALSHHVVPRQPAWETGSLLQSRISTLYSRATK